VPLSWCCQRGQYKPRESLPIPRLRRHITGCRNAATSLLEILGGLHSGVEARMAHLPRTLHGRPYLLSPLFTFALRAAMLTDVYLPAM
jgi:hypothetical protein